MTEDAPQWGMFRKGGEMNARDLMTPNPVTVRPEMPVAEIARLIMAHRINGVPVVDSAGALLGLVTEGDLIHRAADEKFEPRVSLWKENFWRSVFRRRGAEPDKAEGRTAAEVMTRDVITVTPETDVTVVARLLIENAVKALPVVEGRRVVGMISRFDLVKRLGDQADAFNPLRA